MLGTPDQSSTAVSPVLESCIYIGSVNDATNEELLFGKLGVTHIVNCTQREPNHFEDAVKYFRVPVLDVHSEAGKLSEYLEPAADFIDEAVSAGGKVLVHCIAGISRSPTAVLAYMLLHKNMSLAEALEALTKARPAASPNSAFMQALIDLETKVRGAPSVDIECYQGALRSKLGRTEETLWDLIANLHARKGPESQVVVIGGHVMVAHRLLDDPRVAEIDGFVTAEEAAYLIDLAHQTGLKKSHVVGSKGTEEGPKGRRSESCRVERTDAVVRAVVDRAARLVKMSPYCTEPIQVVHYKPDGHYHLHNDWFDPKNPGYAERIKDRGQRIVSIFVYLSDCEEGGCTYFPNIERRFQPKRGSAVLWYNRNRDGQMDDRLLHAGEPVIKGEKYGMNIWFREHPRPGSAAAMATQ